MLQQKLKIDLIYTKLAIILTQQAKACPTSSYLN